MNKNQKFFNILGAVAVVLCIAAFIITRYHDEIFTNKYVSQTQANSSIGIFKMDSDELVYDGQGELDLMQGVHADDGNGNDVTDKVSAVITAEGTLGRKLVRYSFEDASGKTVTKKRTLVLQNYTGPALEVSNSIKISAKNLNDVINVLKNSGELKASDGYKKDITSNVSCVREKLYSNTYRMSFTITNDYGDSVSKSVDVFITGEVKDPEIKIKKKEVRLHSGSIFDAESFIDSYTDGNGENKRNLEIDSNVDINAPGTYRVIYKVYNNNRTAVAMEKLIVTVYGEKYD